MTTDLTQLRWQHIRAVENSQLLLQENIDLKRQLEDLRQSHSADVAQRSKATLRLASGVRKRLRCLRDETNLLKSQMSSEASEMSSSLSELKHQMRKTALLQGKKNADVSLLQGDVADLQRQLAELQSDYADLQRLKIETERASEALSQETKTLRSRCSSLQQEVRSAESLRCEAEEETNRWKILHKPCDDNIQTLNKELSSLKREIARLIQEAADSDASRVNNFETTITDLRRENSELSMEVATLRHQLELLAAKSSSQTSNRSHFAKFMELKNANAALQAQVDKLTRQIQVGSLPVNNTAPISTGKPVRPSRRRNSGAAAAYLTSSTAGDATMDEGAAPLPDERIQTASSNYRATTTDSLIDTLRHNLHRRGAERESGIPPETDDFSRGGLLAPPAPVPMLSPFKLEGAQQLSFRDDTQRSGTNKSPRYLRVSKKAAGAQKSTAGPRPSPYRKRAGIDDSSEENISHSNVDIGEYIPTPAAPSRIVGVQASSVKLQAPPSVSPRGV